MMANTSLSKRIDELSGMDRLRSLSSLVMCKNNLLTDIHDNVLLLGLGICSQSDRPNEQEYLKCGCSKYIGNTSKSSIILPNLVAMTKHISEMVFKYLFDNNIRQHLQDGWVLNSDDRFKYLQPITTTGDGNCLTHAVSIYMWGMHDYACTLRKIIFSVLSDDATIGKSAIKVRWQNECSVQNSAVPGGGLIYDSLEWDSEWKNQVDMCRVVAPENRQLNVLPYDSLDDLHIFVLANIIRRPIIVIADKMYRSASDNTSLAPNLLSGIYLPLLWEAREIYSAPVVIGYHQQHFVPLVPYVSDTFQGEERINAVPLVDKTGELLKVHFLMPEEQGRIEEMLYNYLDLVEVKRPADVPSMGPASEESKLLPKASGVLSWFTSGLSSLAGVRDTTTNRTVNTMIAARLHEPNGNNTNDLVTRYIHSVESEYRKMKTAQSDEEAACSGMTSVGDGNISQPWTGSQSGVSGDLEADLVEYDDAVLSVLPGRRCAGTHCTNNTSIHTHPYCHECVGTDIGAGGKRCGRRECDAIIGDADTTGYCQSCTYIYFAPNTPGVASNGKGDGDVICSTPACLHSKYAEGSSGQPLCVHCYREMQPAGLTAAQTVTAHTEPVASSTLASDAAIVHTGKVTDTSIHCIGPQCYSIGVEELNGLCHSCYDWLKERQTQVQEQQQQRSCNGEGGEAATAETVEECSEESAACERSPCTCVKCKLMHERRQRVMAAEVKLRRQETEDLARELASSGLAEQRGGQRGSVSQCVGWAGGPGGAAAVPCGREADIEYGPYCAACFLQKTKREHDSGSAWPQFRPRDIPGRYVPCASGDCYQWALPEQQGLCDACYAGYLRLVTQGPPAAAH